MAGEASGQIRDYLFGPGIPVIEADIRLGQLARNEISVCLAGFHAPSLFEQF